VVFFAIKPSSSRVQHMEKQKQMNREMWLLAKNTKGVYYLDTYSFMLTPDGKINDELFKNDKLHMNAGGYALWTKKVQWFLKKFD
jgi:lysophospholipase L1-like esterase